MFKINGNKVTGNIFEGVSKNNKYVLYLIIIGFDDEHAS